MKAAAYCRVSTSKDEQLDSLESQQQFFTEYAKKNGFSLVKIYADEGKSGTKMKNRTELLRLLSDAGRGLFEVVLIKDISRLARNTVDFLTSIRALKSLGIKVVFVNYDQTSSDSSEFMLTMLSAIAQEESANTSKRVKFGKRMNAEKGRVPNFVFGYDKIPGDYFNLLINESEAEAVRLIFDMYVNQNMGASKIAAHLNNGGITTKRGSKWSQNAISRILTNKIYIGQIINGKQEIEDFLTGKRKTTGEDKWLTVCRPELRLIEDELFDKAQRILATRADAFKTTGERISDRHVFSKLIKCECCGASFRRYVRSYANTYVKWVCQGRNANGADSCPNKIVIDEGELLAEIRRYFAEILSDKPGAIKGLVSEFKRKYKEKDENEISEKQLVAKLEKAKKARLKYLEMYEMDVITAEELKQKAKEQNAEIDCLNEELRLIKANISKSDILEAAVKEAFKDMETLLKNETLTNAMLRRLIERITADEHGNINVYLKLTAEMGLDNSVLTERNRT